MVRLSVKMLPYQNGIPIMKIKWSHDLCFSKNYPYIELEP